MAWVVLQSASGTQATAATTLAVTYGSNVSSGTKLIALVAIDAASGSVSSVKDGAGNSFTSLGSVSGSTGGASALSLWAIDTPAGDVGTKPVITATFTSGEASLLIQEVSGLLAGNTTAMRDGTAGTVQETTVASQAQPAYSSTASGEYLVACFGDNGGAETYTVPGTYTADANGVNNNISADCVIAYKNSTNGAESGTWTFTGTLTGACYLVVAFKIAAVAVAAPALPLQPPPQPAQPPRPPPSRIMPWLGALTGTALLSGSGTLTAAPFFSGAATLSGTGTLTAAPVTAGTAPFVIQPVTQPAQPPRPLPSQITGSTPAAAFTGAATLTGSGTLAAAPFFSAAAALSGSGTLSAAPAVIVPSPVVVTAVAQPPQPAQPPPGQITGAAPLITFTVGAALSGTGTLTVSYTTAGAPPYIVTGVIQAPQPPAPPPGRILTGPASALLSGATLSGSGTLAAAPFFSAAAALSGAGTLTASYTVAGAQPYVITTVIQPPQPAPPPPGRVLGAPSALLLAAATLTGSGTLAAAPYFDATGTVLSGTGTLAAAYTTAAFPPYIVTAVVQPPQPPPPPAPRVQPPPPPPPPLFTIGILTAGDKATTTLTAASAATATLTATDRRTGGQP